MARTSHDDPAACWHDAGRWSVGVGAQPCGSHAVGWLLHSISSLVCTLQFQVQSVIITYMLIQLRAFRLVRTPSFRIPDPNCKVRPGRHRTRHAAWLAHVM